MDSQGDPAAAGLTVAALLRARYWGRVTVTTWLRLTVIPVELGLERRLVADLRDDEAAALARAYRDAATLALVTRQQAAQQAQQRRAARSNGRSNGRAPTWSAVLGTLRRQGPR
jgi:hypothetical protein